MRGGATGQGQASSAEEAGQGQQGTSRIATLEELLQQRIDVSLEKKEQRSSNPRSIQEVALSIINDEGGDRWGPKGTFPLLEEVLDENKQPVKVMKRDVRGQLTEMPGSWTVL